VVSHHSTSHLPRLELDNGNWLWETTCSLPVISMHRKSNVVDAEVTDSSVRLHSEVRRDLHSNRLVNGNPSICQKDVGTFSPLTLLKDSD
jgi:hypothetical protein